jgi:gliding motility-associated-like protein
MKTKQGLVLLVFIFNCFALFPGSLSFPSVPPPPPPSNDECANAIPLQVQTTCAYTIYDNTNATTNSNAPDPGCGSGAIFFPTYKDIWFSIVVPANGSISIDTQSGSLSDCAMALYSGSCSVLSLIECNDDGYPSGDMPKISKYGLTPGSTVYLRFWEYNNSFGTFGICVTSPTPPPPNAQDCMGAIPVCQNTYSQTTAYSGYGSILDYHGDEDCSGLCLETELNSVWYVFQVQTSGILNFKITPNGPSTDYDWALFNLTNRNCSDLQTSLMPSMVTSCNSAYAYGITGANELTPNTNFDCQGPSSLDEFPVNNRPINVNAGELYYLNIQNWSANTTGYTLDFGNSTATIFDNVQPYIDSIIPVNCGDQIVNFRFSENVLCNTVNMNDFTITGPQGNIPFTSITGPSCAIGGTQEISFTINLAQPIQGGAYQLIYTPGNITDLCGNAANQSTIPFTVSGFLTPVQANSNSPICEGEDLTLSALPIGAASYSWSGPSGFSSVLQSITIPSAVVSNSGLYTVTVTSSSGCETAVNTNVLVDIPPISSITGDTMVAYGRSITLCATAGNSYLWNTGQTTPCITVSPETETTYSVTVSSPGGCSATIERTVSIIDNINIFIPNTFTPNGDGINEVFRPYGRGFNPEGYEFLIFDRWGKLVFVSTVFEKGWNGKVDGVLANINSVFTYRITIYDLSRVEHKYVGSFSILGTINEGY